MRIEFNVTGAKRKELAAALSEILGAPAVYQFVPTCAYKISYFTVTKDGALEFDEPPTEEQLGKLMEFLASRGFTAAETPEEAAETPAEAAASKTEETAEEADSAPQDENLGLTISFPLDAVMASNLTKLIKAKGGLIKKALGLEKLPIEVTKDKVNFPWWETMPEDVEEITAYTNFLSALCRMSKEQKRITAKEKNVDNEKYAFRCFLLRLGFIGAEYKEDRKILLKNLTGNSAFKTTKEAGDEISE